MYINLLKYNVYMAGINATSGALWKVKWNEATQLPSRLTNVAR